MDESLLPTGITTESRSFKRVNRLFPSRYPLKILEEKSKRSREKSSTFSDSNCRQENITNEREAPVVEHLIVSKGAQIFFFRATCVTDLNNIFFIVVVV